MSQWTHICGIVRLDAIEGIFFTRQAGVEAIIREAFGNTFSYNDPPEKWESCNVPEGSEGSIQYMITRTTDGNSLSWGYVSIWGDLRDRGKDSIEQEILAWLNRAFVVLNKRGISVRQATIEVQEEYGRVWAINAMGTQDAPADNENNLNFVQACRLTLLHPQTRHIIISAYGDTDHAINHIYDNHEDARKEFDRLRIETLEYPSGSGVYQDTQITPDNLDELWDKYMGESEGDQYWLVEY